MLFLLAMPLFPLPKVTACLRAVAEQDTTVVLSELMVLPAAVALCWVLGWRWLREGAVPLYHSETTTAKWFGTDFWEPLSSDV